MVCVKNRGIVTMLVKYFRQSLVGIIRVGKKDSAAGKRISRGVNHKFCVRRFALTRLMVKIIEIEALF
jgi:acyl-ACP thioesterase